MTARAVARATEWVLSSLRATAVPLWCQRRGRCCARRVWWHGGAVDMALSPPSLLHPVAPAQWCHCCAIAVVQGLDACIALRLVAPAQWCAVAINMAR